MEVVVEQTEVERLAIGTETETHTERESELVVKGVKETVVREREGLERI